jgi:hypothetical protein
MRADGPTDMMKMIIAFRSFANERKKEGSDCFLICDTFPPFAWEH